MARDIASSWLLLKRFDPSSPVEKWSKPFPLGVFGTLRRGRGNHYLLHRGRIAAVRRAFLPQFMADSLVLRCVAGATAPSEVYFYDAAEWRKTIVGIDKLESFFPEQDPGERGYLRTMALLRLLPSDFEHPLLQPGFDLRGERNLGLAEDTWNEYPQVPCWVYSSRAENRQAARQSPSPILWSA